jgi:integrase
VDLEDKMGYLVQRKERFYAVVYDGRDPLTGRERRTWHTAGRNRDDAEAMLTLLNAQQRLLAGAGSEGGGLTLGQFLTNAWLPAKRLELRPTTAHRYEWMITHYVLPRLGSIPLRRLRVDHLEDLYRELLHTKGRRGTGLAPKTVHNVHIMIRSSLRMAVRRRLASVNVADAAAAPRFRSAIPPMRSWTVAQLKLFLDAAHRERLYPALRLSAMTGMRRGEVLGLTWSAIDFEQRRLTINTAIQLLDSRIIEVPPKTRASRRSVDLDRDTCAVLEAWHDQQHHNGGHATPGSWVFTSVRGGPVNPDLYSQTFDRLVARLDVPKIRLHDLRHTHATLLIKNGEPLKVVSERLGHANPAFTMATYQHVMPGMGANAARRFANLLSSPQPASPEPTSSTGSRKTSR